MIDLTTKQLNALKIVYPEGRLSLIIEDDQNGEIEIIKSYSVNGSNHGIHYFTNDGDNMESDHLQSVPYPTKKYFFTQKEKEALQVLKHGVFKMIINRYVEHTICEAFFFDNEDQYAMKLNQFIDISFCDEYHTIKKG